MAQSLLIGGAKVTSFFSSLWLRPYGALQGAANAIGTSANFSAIQQGSANFNVTLFDEVRSTFNRTRFLDDATHTGLWAHTGVRETATTFSMDCNTLWDAQYSIESYDALLLNKTGFQMVWTLSNSNWSVSAPGANYPIGTVQQWYYCPSVFLSVNNTTVDVSTKPPKLIDLNFHIEANSPAFYMPTDSTALSNFLNYIAIRGWSI
jgi:hypothetical protein